MGQKANLIKTNFSAGEVSPLMHGRVDVTRHKNGAAELNNFVVQPHGGIARRMGTKFIAATKDSSKKSRLIPFQFSDDQAYILEFGEYYIRIFKEQDPVLDGLGAPIEVVTPYAAGDLASLGFCQSADVLYLVHPNHYPRTLARYAENNWQLALLKHEDGPYRGSITADKDITLRLLDAVNRATLKSTANDFASGDVGKFVEYYSDGVLVIGKVITYVSPTEVLIEPQDNIVDYISLDKQAVVEYDSGKIYSTLAIWSSETEYSYIKIGSTWRYMTKHNAGTETYSDTSCDVMVVDNDLNPVIKATTGHISFTNQVITATLLSSVDFFSTPRDVLRHFRLSFGTQNVWGWVASVTDSKTASVRLGVSVPMDPRRRGKYLNNATTTIWKYGAWYKDNYPAVVNIHQQRLIFANTSAEVNRLWFSQSDDYVSFSTATKFSEVLDNSGLNVSVGSSEVNPIVWLQTGPVLLIGTAGEEFQIKPSSVNEALSPTNIQITQQTTYGGSRGIRPLKIGSSTIFIQRYGQTLREMMYSFEIDSFTANDLTIVSEHILRQNGSASSMAFQQVPYGIIWVLCTNGKLVSFTYEKEHQVFAWANHELTDAEVESISVIPSNDLRDDLYLIVKRTINGSVKRYIERLSAPFQPTSSTDYSGMSFLDSCKDYSGAATSIISGLNHLEGKTVSVVANHAIHPDCVVNAGQITLQYPATDVCVGINYTSTVKTLGEEGGSLFGTSHGKLKKIVRVDAQLLNSVGLKYGLTLPDLNSPMSFASSTPVHGSPPELFTGFKELRSDSGFDKNPQFYIVQDQPYPLNILSLAQIVVVNE